MRIKLLLGFIFINTFALGQSLKVEIDNTYNFKPSKLSKAEQQAKFPVMDKLFDKIKNDTAQYLPQLRSELAANGHNPYFYYDGCSLLLALSDKSADRNLIAQAIVKADLEDLNPEMYIRMLNQLANEGTNVTAAALKILNDDKFLFFLPQHVFTFDQGYALTYMLLPQKTTSYVDDLISVFKTSSPTAQRSILFTLWFVYSCKGDELIKAAIDDKSLSKDVRKFAKEVMAHSKLSQEEGDYIKTLGKAELSNLKTEALKRFSDEAVGELDLATKILRRDTSCLQ
ncbi:hypothetical protein [Mucilaginibacter sp.]|uniref:hypothetical protein n=1 Tax=Mucilaginibacter sp. TaxID=1882438 RepID=UPI0025F4D8A0|nr:hypothetical protein [Mucilaginibacter sp.]